MPVEPPTRDLLIASLAAIAGACQLFAWALARLPTFFLVFGLILMAVAFGFGLAALVRHYRLRWLVYVGPASLTIANGSRRTVLPWEHVTAVRYGDFRLRILGTERSRSYTLPVDRTRPADEGAQALLRAVEAQLVARS